MKFQCVFQPNENCYELNNEAPDFHELRDNPLRNNSLFEDPHFPAADDSLSYTDRFRKNYKWQRPKVVSLLFEKYTN